MKIKPFLVLPAVVLAFLAGGAAAQAQATRTWVSGVGDDANPCSRTAPCKTFAGAISKTAANGEISVLDPGGFGAVTITKGITINGDGTLAGILSAGVHGVVVNIVTVNEGDAVILRNLSINGGGTGLDGIRFLAGGQLIVENCSISSVANGIRVAHNGAREAALTVTNTTLTNIGGTAIEVGAAAGVPPTAQISGVRINGAGTGLHVLAGAATIAGSFVTQAAVAGIAVENAGSVINAERCAVDASGTGVSASAGGRVRISDCDIHQNGTGVDVAAGANGVSFGNNRIRGNATDVHGNLSKISQR